MHIYIRSPWFGVVPVAPLNCTDSFSHDEPRVLWPACTENYRDCQHIGLKYHVFMVRKAVRETLRLLKWGKQCI